MCKIIFGAIVTVVSDLICEQFLTGTFKKLTELHLKETLYMLKLLITPAIEVQRILRIFRSKNPQDFLHRFLNEFLQGFIRDALAQILSWILETILERFFQGFQQLLTKEFLQKFLEIIFKDFIKHPRVHPEIVAEILSEALTEVFQPFKKNNFFSFYIRSSSIDFIKNHHSILEENFGKIP